MTSRRRAAVACVLATLPFLVDSRLSGQGGAPVDKPAGQPPPVQKPPALQFVLGDANTVRVSATQPQTPLLTISGVAGAASLAPPDLAKLGASLALADAGVAGGPAGGTTVRFEKPSFVGRNGAGALLWQTPMHIAGVPEGTAHSRLASATLGEPAITHIFNYTLSTKPAAAAQWNVRGAGDTWSLSWSDVRQPPLYELILETQDEPLSNVRLVMSTLRDAAGHPFGKERLELLEAPDGQPAAATNVGPNRIKTIFLRARRGQGWGPHGTYTGALRFAADGSSTVKDVTLKIQATSGLMRLFGILSTALGLMAAWYVTARMRPRLARLQARRPVAVLRQAIQGFREEVKESAKAVDLPMIADEARQLEDSLDDNRLDNEGLLPPPFAGPGDPLVDSGAELKKRLASVSEKFGALSVLLRKGVAPLRRRLSEVPNRPALIALIRELDLHAPLAKGIEDATTKVTGVLRRQPVAGSAETARRTEADATTVTEIDYMIQNVSDVAWLIWAMVSIATGAIWILSDVDYGGLPDLFYSFLWGFGLTTFGAGVQSLTPASVAAPLKLKLPG